MKASAVDPRRCPLCGAAKWLCSGGTAQPHAGVFAKRFQPNSSSECRRRRRALFVFAELVYWDSVPEKTLRLI
jgi:hypothetical protein